MIVGWIGGLLRTRTALIVGTVAGIAATVGLITALGAFIQYSSAEMTARAAAAVPIDWQAETVRGASPEMVGEAMRSAAPIARTSNVDYAAADGFEADAGGTVQVTGPGKAIGIEPNYVTDFPGNFRPLLGAALGVLIAQQTAANLHVAPGDRVRIHRPGLADAEVTIEGVVDLPNADAMFQAVGAPTGAQPQAPPDNVLILPSNQWHTLFDRQAEVRPDSVRTQIHANLDRANLARDPQAAFIAVTNEGHNFEARAAGNAFLSNNLAAILGTAREDAFYARILFLFLGTPGAAAAILLTIAVARAGMAQRRRDQSLLRLRGAPISFLLKIAAVEALAVGLCGSMLGIFGGSAISAALLGVPPFGAGGLVWLPLAAAAGILLALASVLAPAWWDARHLTIVSTRSPLGRAASSPWQAGYLDLVCIAAAALIFWKTAASGYQIVLAPEGVAAISIDYWAFLSPLLLWLGMSLLGLRLMKLFLSRAPNALRRLLQPVAGNMTALVSTALARQPERLARGGALIAVAIAFAISTAMFNATYQMQSRVDAELTNGADVTVTGSSAAPAGQIVDLLAALSGVKAAVPMQHRFAYVGTDLQDLYGIDPTTIGQAATMANAYFGNGNAQASLAALSSTPDGVLVSDETVTDFQLKPGDSINLRLQSATDHQYHPVPFHFVGIVREFPTAPTDSFLVVNADYVAKMTGSAAAEVVLMRASGDPVALRRQAEQVVSVLPRAKVRDITEARRLIGSSLTAIDLRGLTRLELSYAAVLSACAAGLVLALSLLERRRSFAIIMALGGKRQHLQAFLRGEALLVLLGGTLCGLVTGATVAWLLVTLLIGVFDPPPDHMTIPWIYLCVLLAVTGGAVAAALRFVERRIEVSPAQVLRESL